jgi:hypothetical protein
MGQHHQRTASNTQDKRPTRRLVMIAGGVSHVIRAAETPRPKARSQSGLKLMPEPHCRVPGAVLSVRWCGTLTPASWVQLCPPCSAALPILWGARTVVAGDKLGRLCIQCSISSGWCAEWLAEDFCTLVSSAFRSQEGIHPQ